MTTQRSAVGVAARWAGLQRVMVTVLAIAGAGVSFVLAPGFEGAMGSGLALLMAAIAAVDARHFRIPDALSTAGFALALLRAGLQGGDLWLPALAAALLRAAILAALFWSVRIIYRRLRGREGLGFGDVKLAGVAGAWLAWVTVPVAIEMAALSAIAFYLLRQRGIGHRMRANSRIPFGAFFAPAIWLGWVFQSVMLGRF